MELLGIPVAGSLETIRRVIGTDIRRNTMDEEQNLARWLHSRHQNHLRCRWVRWITMPLVLKSSMTYPMLLVLTSSIAFQRHALPVQVASKASQTAISEIMARLVHLLASQRVAQHHTI
jgi:hypothetical protein